MYRATMTSRFKTAPAKCMIYNAFGVFNVIGLNEAFARLETKQ